MKKSYLFILTIVMVFSSQFVFSQKYPIVETNISEFYSDNAIISAPSIGEDYYGQDATYHGHSNTPSYTNNNDGTITDNVTDLVWQQDMGVKISYADAIIKADTMTLGGYSDWRVPTIKELYSLILFTGKVKGEVPSEMFIDSAYFNHPLGDTTIGERLIDAQTWSSTQYISTTMNGDSTVFGVNFLDGRIKGYPKYAPGSNNTNPKTMYFRMLRGNTDYGKNDFVDNNDQTISDIATGLMWQKADDGQARDWKDALAYAEGLSLAGYSDWRLPNAKELESIVDYSRCPDITNSPAIDPVFTTTGIDDPDGNSGQYPYFWTGTSHLDGQNPYNSAAYIAFGEAQGKINNNLMDVHGAGAQRSDPKSGSAANYPDFFGPQGDVRYVFNYVRCVRDISPKPYIDEKNKKTEINIYPNPMNNNCFIELDKTCSNISVVLVNSLGKQLVVQHETNTDKIIINTEKLSQGFYFLIVNADGQQLTKKIVKE